MNKMTKPSSSPPVRMEKVENIIRIMNKMAGSSSGVSIADIMEEYNVCRRTAERMMNVIKRIYPDYDVLDRDDLHKAISLPTLYRQGPFTLSKNEILALNKAVQLAKTARMDDLALEIEAVENRLRATAKPNIRRNAEDISDSSIIACYAGPKMKIDSEKLSFIEDAIIKSQKLSFYYTAKGTGKRTFYTVQPYGVLYGPKAYMVACLDGTSDYRYFIISNIDEIEEKEGFIRNNEFSLKKYAEQSFGSYQEKPSCIVWKASKNIVDEVVNYHFHPTQKIEKQKDGSVLIKFTAGGLKEMCHHLFTWEGEIEIISPPELKEMMKSAISKFNID